MRYLHVRKIEVNSHNSLRNQVVLTVRIQGGLGNQMFQYAFARALQRRGLSVAMHWHPPRRKSLHTGYSLDSVFAAPLKHNVPLRNDRLLSSITDTVHRKFYRIRQSSNVGFDPTLLEIESGYIDGYFQSARYFADFSEQIRKELAFRKISGPKNAELLEWIDKNFVVAVHIRGGDYLNRGAHSGDMGVVCGPAYYQAALQEMDKQQPTASYLVFSDDFDYANRLMGDRGFRNVDWNTGQDSWKDMALMSRCSAHITANSSFSWWGSWLADSKLRIMPRPWFPAFAASYNHDIYPDGAVTLKCPESPAGVND